MPTSLRTALRYVVLAAIALVVLFPLYVTVVNALLPGPQIARRPPTLFPLHPLWSSFATAWDEGSLGDYLRTSAIVAVATTLAELATSVLAAYAFAFLEFPFKRALFACCLATLMVPAEVTIIPNYRTIQVLGWYDTYTALIVPFVASGLGIFLFRQSFRQVPRELRDAAVLDGYGHWRFLLRVVLPLNRPIVGAFCVFAFLGSWNQYLWPLLVTNTNARRTVQVGLRQLEGLNVAQQNVIFAGTILAALPIFAILLVFQRQLVRGLTAGALKG
ncbi:MAG TPA: carbohydrate ABC transporter permease [Acidimicrobiales bacterium]|nr:carbohydrate ABC transporter permease [Acidimicrobiales bacterium]